MTFLRTMPKSLIAAGVLLGAGSLALVAPSGASAITTAQVAPIYISPGNEAAVNVNIGNAPTSFGYYFDIATDGQGLNALGIAAPIQGSGTYNVTLWKYVNGGAVLGDYTQLATTSFNAACVGCVQKGNFFWLDVPTVRLSKTTGDASTGYVVSAIGDYAAGQSAVFYNGTGTFAANAVFEGGGYNFTGDPFFAIPVGPVSDIIAAPGTTGFFNANISTFEVPGPLPIFGAAAAFGWSRRMRRRISAAS